MPLSVTFSPSSVSVAEYSSLPPSVTFIHMPDETIIADLQNGQVKQSLTLGRLRHYLAEAIKAEDHVG